jgi:exodeoxyribonuclease V beta subunit
MTAGPPHFDICGRMPGPGVTVLEASAGTGKTFTIAGLVARMVAEGVAPLSEILVVTFTRMATGELRDRVRARLVSAESGLGRMIDCGDPLPAGDTLLELLATGPTEVVAGRRQRLADALTTFDSATITTTHGFCHMVLAALGVWGGVAAAPTLVEDPTDLVEEVVDDLLTRHVLRSGAVPFRRRAAVQAGLKAVNNPETPLEPEADQRDPTPVGLRRRLARAAREEVGRRLVDGNLLTYDDLLVRLARALEDGERGPQACLRLRQRYRVVLVDEFQDTDAVQWKVVRQAFGDGATCLVLIGDPKQAVYSFRGADVYAYLEAARTAGPDDRFTLAQNWRSDAALLAAYDALLDPVHLGHPEIVYRRVQATTAHQRPGLVGAPKPEPLRARLVPSRDRAVAHTPSGRLLQKDAAVRFVADDLAADVVALVGSGAILAQRGGEGDDDLPRKIGAGDIGVVVRTNRQAVIVQSALQAAGVPVVVAGAQSVLATQAAHHWLTLLGALEHPAARSAAAAAALTPFLGMTAPQLAAADETSWGELHSRLHDWSGLVRRGGVAALFWHITVTEGLPARVLAFTDGERQLTDLGHIAELLNVEAGRAQLGLAALKTWLARRVDEATSDGTEAEQRSRRLGSDAAAVQVLTVHRAKGLEFPVVYCPYLWDAGRHDLLGEPVVFHDHDDQRKLDVGGAPDDPAYSRHYQAAQVETRGEDLRHLYVALTRARHQAVVWWAGAKDCQHSALGRLLLARSPSGDVSASGRSKEPKDAEVEAELRRLAQRAPRLISVEYCAPLPAVRGSVAGPHLGAPDLAVARFGRDLDLGWRRSSYTSITAAAHVAGTGTRAGPVPLVSSEPEQPGTTDEALTPLPTVVPLVAPVPSPEVAPMPTSVVAPEGESTPLLAGVPAGAEIGTLVHAVFESVDFAAADLRSAVLEAVRARQAEYAGQPFDPELMATGLEAVMLTPLGGLAEGARLRDFSRRQRLDELGFELPLAGGDASSGEVLLSDIASLLARYVGAGEPLYGYADSLADPQLVTDLRGYLTGSLDVVLRLPVKGNDRYFVADYKTNWLAGPAEPLSTGHYRPDVLGPAMCRAHYPLQAIFYLVALHRYLRWRQPGYDPALHLGGALYLFVRGMVGPSTPVLAGEPYGVFSWRPPVALVVELSDLLASGRRLPERV